MKEPTPFSSHPHDFVVKSRLKLAPYNGPLPGKEGTAHGFGR